MVNFKKTLIISLLVSAIIASIWLTNLNVTGATASLVLPAEIQTEEKYVGTASIITEGDLREFDWAERTANGLVAYTQEHIYGSQIPDDSERAKVTKMLKTSLEEAIFLDNPAKTKTGDGKSYLLVGWKYTTKTIEGNKKQITIYNDWYYANQKNQQAGTRGTLRPSMVTPTWVKFGQLENSFVFDPKSGIIEV